MCVNCPTEKGGEETATKAAKRFVGSSVLLQTFYSSRGTSNPAARMDPQILAWILPPAVTVCNGISSVATKI